VPRRRTTPSPKRITNLEAVAKRMTLDQLTEPQRLSAQRCPKQLSKEYAETSPSLLPDNSLRFIEFASPKRNKSMTPAQYRIHARREQVEKSRMALDVLIPEDLQGYVLRLQLAMNLAPVGLAAGRSVRHGTSARRTISRTAYCRTPIAKAQARGA